MFHNITQAYDKTDATWEIIIMLSVAFLLGMLVHWAFSDDEPCCADSSKKSSNTKSLSAREAQTKRKSTSVSRKKTVTKKSVRKKKDNLRMIDGIGPKIEQILNANGITTYSDLAKANKQRLQDILEQAGPRFQMHDPSTWAAQARKLMK